MSKGSGSGAGQNHQCYLCAANMTPFPEASGLVVLGNCNECSVYACNGHGQRDSKKGWVCAICEANILSQSAFQRVANLVGAPAGDNGAGGFGGLDEEAAEVERGEYYESLEDYWSRGPGYRERLRGRFEGFFPYAAEVLNTDHLMEATRGVESDDEALRLLACAILLAHLMAIHQDFFLPAFREVLKRWREFNE